MKKIVAILLTVLMLTATSVIVFAANTEGGSTEVSFNVDPTYTVVIPEVVELAKVENEGVITYENDYTVTAEAGLRLKKGEYIEVTIDTDNEMTTAEGATLDYEITLDGEELENNVVATFTTNKAEQKSTIHISAGDPDYAGDYKDTVTFTITVKTN